MDNIQLYHIDNEINKIDEMKEGDVIYKNGMELLVVLSYDHNELCRGCFFYKDKKCGSERLIKCWDCKKEYIFMAIRKYNTTLAIDESWNNVYSDITLPSGDMGAIKVERIDDDKKNNDIR